MRTIHTEYTVYDKCLYEDTAEPYTQCIVYAGMRTLRSVREFTLLPPLGRNHLLLLHQQLCQCAMQSDHTFSACEIFILFRFILFAHVEKLTFE